jgi:hypothetical protein
VVTTAVYAPCRLAALTAARAASIPGNVVRPLLAIVIVIAACSADEAPGLHDPAQFLAQVRTAECDTMVRCRIFGSAETCDLYRHHRLPLPAGIVIVPDVDWLAELADGHVVYSPSDAAACLAAWRDPACRSTAGLERCATVFRGTALAGTDTYAPQACAAGYWKESGCSGGCCRGICARQLAIPSRPEGTACGVVDEVGQRCDRHLACRLGRCARLSVGDACEQDLDCPPGLLCDGRCRPRLAIGEVCSRADDCGDLGSYCGFDVRCHRLPLDGELCNDGMCGPGLGCDPLTGRCAGFRTEAESCAELGVALCSRGLYCDRWDGTCRPQRPDGADCSDGPECITGVCGSGFVCGATCR